MRFRQYLTINRSNPFFYKERNQKERTDVKLRVFNSVYTNVSIDKIPVCPDFKDQYIQGTNRYRVAKKRFNFRESILYPSIRKYGIVDPLFLQFLTNVPEELGGFICVVGNNRLRVLYDHKDLNMLSVPCFVVNILGEGGSYQKSPVEGELITSEKERLIREYYRSEILRFLWNNEGYLIGVSVRRFMGDG